MTEILQMTKTEKISISISFVAIVLTQFKPLHEYLSSSNLQYDLGSYISINEQLGYQSLIAKLNISNSGDQHGKLNDIVVFITHNQNKFQYLANVIGTYEQQNWQITPFNGVFLPAQEYWNNTVLINDSRNFANESFVEETMHWQERYYAELGRFDEYEEERSISDELFEEFRIWYINKMRAFPVGHYHMLLIFREDSKTQTLLYEFHISAQKKRMFLKNIERYRYGEGIVAPFKTGANLATTLTLVSNENIIERIKSEYKKYRKKKDI